ncbi:MAG: response regulator [bacterium]
MGKNILVIDDNEAIRKSFKLALEDEEYNIFTAESGEKGIELRKKSTFDLFFIDLKMPGMNGVETLREIRKVDSEVPIYIITAFHKEFLNELKSAAEDGISFEILQKPIGSKQIVLTVRSVFEGPASY